MKFLKKTQQSNTTHDLVTCILWCVHMLLIKDVESKSWALLEADAVQIPIVQIPVEEVSALVAPARLLD